MSVVRWLRWTRALLTGKEGIVILDNLRGETCPFHLIVPTLLDRPALYPLDQPVGPQHKVNGDDNEPDESPHAPRRDAEQRDGKRRLAPAGGEDGAKPSADGVQGDGRDGFGIELGKVPAQPVGYAGRLQGDRGDESDLQPLDNIQLDRDMVGSTESVPSSRPRCGRPTTAAGVSAACSTLAIRQTESRGLPGTR